MLAEWQLPVGFDAAAGAAGRMPGEPDVWTDDSLVQDKLSGACSAGSGFFLMFLIGFGLDGFGNIWMMMLVKAELIGLAVVTALFLVLFQSVQRGEFRGVILALQANDAVHLGGQSLGCASCRSLA